MKVVALLVILYCSAHWNNSIYFPLLVTLYMYFASTKVVVIMFLNHLSLSVSYLVLQTKF